MSSVVMSNKRSWRLQEFLAHTSPVSCITLGSYTGRVMATGGEDKRVNMWALGNPKCIMSLTGHTAPIDSVNFNASEDHVIAGTRSGSLKLWNLEASKAVRALSGHMASVTCTDFHPVQSDYVASGCRDSNVKIWDIRRKGCLITYKGHRDEVSDVKFSPDGKWIASASNDGVVKLWSLDKGSMVTEFKAHQGAVNCLCFHPTEFILASGSADRTVNFYDLEGFSLIGSSDSDSTSVRSLLFHQDGYCLFAGCVDNLKIYGYEPVVTHDTVSVSWGNVMKISVTQSQLVGASYSHNTVQTFVVDTKKCKPFYQGPPFITPPRTTNDPPSRDRDGNQPSESKSIVPDALRKNEPIRRSHRRFSRPEHLKDAHLQIKEETPDPAANADTEDDAESVADIQEPAKYTEIFKPSRSLNRTPTDFPLFEEPNDDDMFHLLPKVYSSRANNGPSGFRRPSSDLEHGTPRRTDNPTSKRQPQTSQNNAAVNSVAKNVNNLHLHLPAQPPIEPPMVDVKDFLPKRNFPKSPENVHSSLLSKIKDKHHLYSRSLEARCQNLQVVRTMWTDRDTRSAISYCVSMMDDSVIVDVLKFMSSHQDLWSLEIAALLLPVLERLTASKYSQHLSTACQSVKIILHHFSALIKSTLQQALSIGVDISKEERTNRCKACYSSLINIETILQQKTTAYGKKTSVPNDIQQTLMLLRCLRM